MWLLAGLNSCLQGCLRTWQLATPTVNDPRKNKKQRTQGGSGRVFYNLVSAVTSHDFCHMLNVTTESISPAHTQEEEITQGMNTRRWGGGDHYQQGAVFQCAHHTFHALWYSSKCSPMQRKSNTCLRIHKCQAFTLLHCLLIIPRHAEILNIHGIVTENSDPQHWTKKYSAFVLANTEYHVIAFRNLGDIFSLRLLIMSWLALSGRH